jgi:hypothetical protein
LLSSNRTIFLHIFTSLIDRIWSLDITGKFEIATLDFLSFNYKAPLFCARDLQVMHRLESEVDEAGRRAAKDQKSQNKSTLSGNRKSKDLDLFGELEKAIGDSFDTRDLRKFTGENPAERLIYKRICISRISAKACLDVIIPVEDDDVEVQLTRGGGGGIAPQRFETYPTDYYEEYSNFPQQDEWRSNSDYMSNNTTDSRPRQ